jgi:hypothetical protein
MAALDGASRTTDVVCEGSACDRQASIRAMGSLLSDGAAFLADRGGSLADRGGPRADGEPFSTATSAS